MTLTHKDFEEQRGKCELCEGLNFVCKPQDGFRKIHKCFSSECRTGLDKCIQKIWCPRCKGSGNGIVEEYIGINIPDAHRFSHIALDWVVFKDCSREESCIDCVDSPCNKIMLNEPIPYKFGQIINLNNIKVEVRGVEIINIGQGISEYDLSKIRGSKKPHFKIKFLEDSLNVKLESTNK